MTLPSGAMPAAALTRSRWNRTLPLQMLGGLVVGCILGMLNPDLGKELLPLGQAFIKALRMIVIPLVFSSIALGIYNMGRELAVLGRGRSATTSLKCSPACRWR
jgi:DAACS family dicarboxylate/amino acid:cation (Na+ or H+) symporter